MDELYKNIKDLRIEKGLSQSELAKLTGYSDRSSIAKIESGLVDLSLTKIKLFAKVLNVSPGELMGKTSADNNRITTIAAHHNEPDWTEEELQEIETFKQYVLSKRK